MPTAEIIAELELEHTRQRELLRQVTARLRGIENELEVLRSGGEVPGTALSDMTRTDAIVEVLRGSRTAMSPTGILAALTAGGRDDRYSSVTATLDYLCKGPTVTKIGRGQYLAV